MIISYSCVTIYAQAVDHRCLCAHFLRLLNIHFIHDNAMKGINTMYKKILRILPLMLALILIFALAPTSQTAAVQSKEDKILQQITDIYAKALKASGRYSFRGYCGAFVNRHMNLLGITTNVNTANGNQQYNLYADMEMTNGGYRVEALSSKKYSMKEALNYLTSNGTVDVYNLIVGFQYTNTTAGKKYGHATFVHAILDGKVYFSESYSTTINGTYYAEGSPIVLTIDQFYKYYKDWTTYEGVVHFGLKTYQDACEFLPAYLYVTVNKDAQLYSAACTPDVDKSSVSVRSLKAGERLSVIGMYRNTKGQYWYQVEDAEICYVLAEDTDLETLRHDDVTVSGVSAPTEQRQGNIFDIKGNIKSTYNSICSVRAQVFTITDSGLKHWMTTTDVVENNSYSLSYSVVSNRMAFRLLDLGNYRYEMAVVVSNNYVEDGLLQTQYTTLKLWCSDFRVVAKKGGSASVQFDTCGGTAGLNAAELELGATIGELPQANRDGYHFLGWYTEVDGGELVREDYIVESNMTLYAHWAEATDITGWFMDNGRPYYVLEGQRVIGFFQVDGITYYQTEEGFLATGWMDLDETRYYFNTNGSMMLGWLEIDRCFYYFGADGTATIGWAEIDGNTYYFGDNCVMVTGEYTIEDVIYVFGEDGALIME